jgi:hypothetical protein
MTLLTPEIREQMLKNGREQYEAQAKEQSIDFEPVVKLFTPWAGATWLLTELHPNDPDVAFGLCDLGMGMPELGYVRISEIEDLRGPGWLTVERDLHFVADKALSEYAAEAHQAGSIVA